MERRKNSLSGLSVGSFRGGLVTRGGLPLYVDVFRAIKKRKATAIQSGSLDQRLAVTILSTGRQRVALVVDSF